MVYLSANGEVLGSFEEEAVPGLMAAGTITEAAYYWREGMSEWLPVADLLQLQTKRREAPWPAPAVQLKPAVVLPSAAGLGVRRPFVMRRRPAVVEATGAAPERAASQSPPVATSAPQLSPLGEPKPAVVLPSAAGLGVRKPFMVWRSPAVAEATGAAPKRAASQTHPVAAGPDVKKPLVMGRGPGAAGATGTARQNETVKIMTPTTTKPVSVPQAGKSGASAAPQLSPVPVGEPKPAAGLLGLKKLFAMWRGPAAVGATGAAAKSADGPSKPAAASAPAAGPQNEAVKSMTPTTTKPVLVPQVEKSGALGASQLSPAGVTKPSAAAPADKKSLVIRRGPAAVGATGAEAKSAETPSKPATMSAPAAAQQSETVHIMTPATFGPAAEAQVKPEAVRAFLADGSGAPKKGRGWLARLAWVLVFAAVASGGAWWWVANAEPPFIHGTVALAGDESAPVQIRVFRRADLVVPWRERLAAAEKRGAELEGLLAGARVRVVEKSLLRDEAASVFKVGEEYNMPDVAELRADRDAKQAEAEAAQAEVQRMELEKGGLLTLEGLLGSVPTPIGTVAAGEGGVFALPPPEEDVVLLATVTVGADGQLQQRAWLEVLEVPVDGEALGPVRFAEINRLDLDEIRRFAAADAP